MKLNYRDKVILGIVLAIAIFLAGYFALIKPKNQKIKDNNKKLEQLDDQVDEVKKKIARIEPLRTTIDATFEDADEISKIFVPKEKIEKATLLDQFMKEYAEKNKVRVIDLKVDDIAIGSLSYYYKPYTEVASALREEVDINGTLQENFDKENAETEFISGRNVETVLSTRYGLEVRGKLKDVFKYLDSIRDTKEAIIVTSFGFEKIEKDKDDTSNAGGADKDDKDDENDKALDPNKGITDPDKKEEAFHNYDEVNASIVVELYSIYNMEKPVTE